MKQVCVDCGKSFDDETTNTNDLICNGKAIDDYYDCRKSSQ